MNRGQDNLIYLDSCALCGAVCRFDPYSEVESLCAVCEQRQKELDAIKSKQNSASDQGAAVPNYIDNQELLSLPKRARLDV